MAASSCCLSAPSSIFPSSILGTRGTLPVLNSRNSLPPSRQSKSRSLSVRSSIVEALPPAYGGVLLTAAASAAVTQWQMIQVSIQRRKSEVPYPKMYEDKEDSLFNCYQRAHLNTLENYPQFVALLLASGVAYPITSSVLGMVWVIGRIFYSLGYYTGDPKKRMQGAWGTLGLFGLIITSAVFGIKQLL